MYDSNASSSSFSPPISIPHFQSPTTGGGAPSGAWQSLSMKTKRLLSLSLACVENMLKRTIFLSNEAKASMKGGLLETDLSGSSLWPRSELRRIENRK